MARSFSDNSAIRYVLPVVWMTSCLHVMEPVGQNLTFMFRRFREVAALGAKLLSTIAGLLWDVDVLSSGTRESFNSATVVFRL